MNRWRWSGSALVLLGLVALAGLKSPLFAQAKDGPKLEWKAFDPKGKVFYQEMTSKIEQKMKVMGMEVVQNTNQTFYTSWTPKELKDGNYVVVQKILGIKMDMDIGGNKIVFDSTSETPPPNNPLSDFFNALKAAELTFTIKPADMTIVNIEGRDEFLNKLNKANPQMEPLLKSILSKEALQQMAEQTWFALPPKDAGKTWKRESKLDLGPIGTYDTKYDFTNDGPNKDKLDAITAKATLVYSPPAKKDGLPFSIKSGKLLSEDGKGEWLFDPAQGRFQKASVNMVLKGDLEIDVGGMVTNVKLDQKQESTSTFTETDPLPQPKKAAK